MKKDMEIGGLDDRRFASENGKRCTPLTAQTQKGSSPEDVRENTHRYAVDA